MKTVIFLNDLKCPDISQVGGKAANLGILSGSGFPVPHGFCLTTEAYKAYIVFNHLKDSIREIIRSTNAEDILSLDNAFEKIRDLFQSGTMPGNTADEIRAAYDQLLKESSEGGSCPVAVRSSATAEDLPDMSFAGQQDTYLNVCGLPSVMEAVVNCWGSLWTARAIGYRSKNGIDHEDIALAVVVQQMVQSDVSGVMFTANPLTGKRTETVIDATFGLGEALVSGQVQPDHYVYDQAGGIVIGKTIGEKGTTVRSLIDGGVALLSEKNPNRQALTDDQIKELAETGQRIADLYMSPQDIEWAFHENRLYILQSRSVTSLYPLTEGKKTLDYIKGDLKAYFSFASWQVMLDPITPLGRDLFSGIAAGVAHRLGYCSDMTSQNAFVSAGERLYLNISPLITNKMGRVFLKEFLSSIDPDAASIILKLYERPEFGVVKKHIPFKRKMKLLSVPVRMIFNALRNLVNPASGTKRYERRISAVVAYLEEKCRSIVEQNEFADFILEFFRTEGQSLMIYIPTCTISGQMALQILSRLASKLPDGKARVLELTRGLPNNPTTEMDLSLWSAAKSIKNCKESYDIFKHLEAPALTDLYMRGKLPVTAQSELAGFLGAYGIRGIAEIDIGRARWADDPTPIMQIIKSYIEIKGDASAPDKVFLKSAKISEEAGSALIREMKKTSHNPIKITIIRFLIRRIRQLVGLREAPKFAIVRMFMPMREALLRFGRTMADDGLLERSGDIFFLHLTELQKSAAGLKEIIHDRKYRYDFEKRRKSIPKIILSDGTAFFEGSGITDDNDDSIKGNPVSAGIVEGTVRIVLNPYETRILPGEILVCPATDPAWTPLFLIASGLVTEIGGMMTHGSVIAREYGIPAVVGVSGATTRLKTGQKIRLNGNTGQIQLLE